MTETLITTVAELQEAVTAEARKAVQGQQQVLEQMLVCLLSRGHVLLEGVPGIAKTLLAKTLAAIDGADHPLSEPFFVVATQNPIEYEGTYPLPEAQLDRFLLKVLVDYPDQAEEEAVLRQAHKGFESHNLEAAGVRTVVTPAALAACVAAIERVHVHDAVLS